jgi:hypothetical protein
MLLLHFIFLSFFWMLLRSDRRESYDELRELGFFSGLLLTEVLVARLDYPRSSGGITKDVGRTPTEA